MHLASYRRHLRARNRSASTIGDYLYRLGQLAKAHPGVDITTLAPAQIDDYLVSMLERQEASSVAIHFRTARAFFNWCVREEIIRRSPMAGMDPPKVTDRPPPIVPDDVIRALLKSCSGTGFEARRDTALIRMWLEPGSPRVSEMAGMTVADLDLRHDQVTIRGKGDHVRVVPFGAKTGTAVDRYLRQRAKHPKVDLPALWLGGRGQGLTASGLEQMLRRRCRRAGLDPIHPHQLRHTSAHNWADSGGSDQDAMILFGWKSPEMPRIYGRSASAERARRAARRASLADRF